MVRGRPSAADTSIIEAAAAQGLTVSAAQLERWRADGVLPRNTRQALGRGRGSRSHPTSHGTAVAIELARRSTAGVPLPQVVLGVFFECPELPVPVGSVRSALRWYLTRRDASAHGRASAAAKAARAAGATDEAVEDAVATSVAEHFQGLGKPVLAALRGHVPHIEDLTLVALMGVEALGGAAVDSIPSGSEDDGLSDALKSAMREKLGSDEAPTPPALYSTFNPDVQVAALEAATSDQLCNARDVIQRLAISFEVVQAVSILEPGNEQAGALMDVMGSMFFLTALAVMFPPQDLGDPLDWEVGAKLVTASVVSPSMGGQLKGLADLFGADTDDLLERVSELLKQYRPGESTDGPHTPEGGRIEPREE